MRTIIEILGIEITKTYTRTYARLDNGEECVGYGTDFDIGDLVEVFYHSKYDVVKMRKKPL